VIVFHGDRDATVAHANAGYLIDHVLAAGLPNPRNGTAPTAVTISGQVPGGLAFTRTCYQDRTGGRFAEYWSVHQGGHGWSGGAPHEPYTNPHGPNASAEFIRFFGEHPASEPDRLLAPGAANVSHGRTLGPN
jgi:poly(3-hydroxybutyrate) depolymerase